MVIIDLSAGAGQLFNIYADNAALYIPTASYINSVLVSKTHTLLSVTQMLQLA